MLIIAPGCYLPKSKRPPTPPLYHVVRPGDALELLESLADESVDACVTDPPYQLDFMGKRWDSTGITYRTALWRQVLRVLRPGGHLLAFGGSRTSHRMAVAIEDAGFELRDTIMWIYGSGFPKSANVSKAIDKMAGAQRGTVRVAARPETSGTFSGSMDTRPWIEKSRETGYHEVWDSKPVTAAAKLWDGWGTALKPAHEPIVVARKPFDGTVAHNVLEHGTGAINIDGCRVGTQPRINAAAGNKPGGNALHLSIVGMPQDAPGTEATGRWPANVIHDGSDEVLGEFEKYGESRSNGGPTGGTTPSTKHAYGKYAARSAVGHVDAGTPARFFADCGDEKSEGNFLGQGRWPANVILDGSDEVEAEFEKYGTTTSTPNERHNGDYKSVAKGFDYAHVTRGHSDTGTPSRFFYTAKASKKDRGEGNHHPTVKPVALMRYLVRLITLPGGLVLDPFAGSGSTGVACKREGFSFIGFELLDENAAIAIQRIENCN